MKKTKERNYLFQKNLLVVIVCILLFLFASDKNVNAAASDSKQATYEQTEVKKNMSTQYTDFSVIEGKTTYQGSEYNQRVHVFFQKQTPNSKVVTWAVKSNAGKFARCTVSAIAQDYEAYHPGW